MYPFSLTGYQQLLETLLQAGYHDCPFTEIENALAEKQQCMVLRHDIDISLRPALKIAQIEHELGVSATYFVLLSSPFYNLFSRQNAEIIQQIHDYGHDIALHVDLTLYHDDYAAALGELHLLTHFYPFANTQLVSLHSPLNLRTTPVESIPQLNAVYGAFLRGALSYISDSTGRWRYGHPLDSETFYQRQPMQLLTHPIWWCQDGETPPDRLNRWLYADYLHNSTLMTSFLPKLFQGAGEGLGRNIHKIEAETR